jgi:hypothetical protein
MFLACLLSGCAAQKYPIDAMLSCDCVPSDQRVHEIIAIAESSGYVRNAQQEHVWPDRVNTGERRVTLAYLTFKSSSDIELAVTDYAGKLIVFLKIKRYYSPVTDAENGILLNFESRLARQQPGMWTERRRDFQVGNDVDRKL